MKSAAERYFSTNLNHSYLTGCDSMNSHSCCCFFVLHPLYDMFTASQTTEQMWLNLNRTEVNEHVCWCSVTLSVHRCECFSGWMMNVWSSSGRNLSPLLNDRTWFEQVWAELLILLILFSVLRRKLKLTQLQLWLTLSISAVDDEACVLLSACWCAKQFP